MTNTEAVNRAVGELRRLALALAALILVVGAIVVVNIHRGQINGCKRGIQNNAANAQGWRTAEQARRASYQRDGAPEDLAAAERYDQIASLLERRARIDCSQAYPLLSL